MLNREPMVMKAASARQAASWIWCFSAQPRADGDEGYEPTRWDYEEVEVSVLNREPMVMKGTSSAPPGAPCSVSVLNREPMVMKDQRGDAGEAGDQMFQCSTASRW